MSYNTVYSLAARALFPANASYTNYPTLVFPPPAEVTTALNASSSLTFTLYTPAPQAPLPALYTLTVTATESLTTSFTLSQDLQASPNAAINLGVANLTVLGASLTEVLAPTSSSSSSSISSASQTSTTVSATPSGGYSTGALAGAAVGCAIGGILLGCLIAFFLFRRRGRQSHSQRSSGTEKDLSPFRDQGDVVFLGSGPKPAWMSYLPQSDTDNTIRAAANRVLDQIEMHVENFYFDKNIPHMDIETQSAVEDFESTHLPESILRMLPRTDRSTLLLKHCLTNLILSHIDSRNAGPSSFLPKDLTNLKLSSAKMVQPGFAQALSQWRVLSRFLRQDPDHDQTYLAERDRAIFTTAQNFCRAFEPWARSEESLRLQSLVGIMKRASDLGILLFSQPATFHWQWERLETSRSSSSVRKGGTLFVVLPGLYKTTDQETVSLVSPLHLIEPQIASIGVQ